MDEPATREPGPNVGRSGVDSSVAPADLFEGRGVQWSAGAQVATPGWRIADRRETPGPDGDLHSQTGRRPEIVMGQIRDRMDADLRLAGRSESTRKHYMSCAKLFVKHYMRSPEDLGAAEVRAFLLLEKERVSLGRYLQYLSALKFLYRVTLGRPEVVAGIPYPKVPRARPNVMTHEEIARVFAAARTAFWRTFFITAYAAGLRRMEVAGLRAQDIDSKSGLIRVVRGKGGKAREVMLDPALLPILREHWRYHGLPGPFLFPARTEFSGWSDHAVNLNQATEAFHRTKIRAKIARRVTLHSLRHSFATHMLEDGGNVFVLQRVLGHHRLETTLGYVLVTTDHIRATPSPFGKPRK